METVAVWTGAAGENFCNALTSDGTHIYAGLWLGPVKVFKINPATMETVAVWTGAADEGNSWFLTFDGNFLFIGLSTDPAKLIRKIMRDINETET